MTKPTFAIAAIAAVSLTLGGGTARAQAVTAVTFAAVDGIRYDAEEAGVFYVKGVVQGEATAREIRFNQSTSAAPEEQRTCERFALLMMERPGKYLITLQGGWWMYATVCSLARVNP